MKTLITLGAIIAACTLSVPAMAERGGDRVDARQDRQQHRIDRGVRSGDLTRPEARRLDRGQNRIDHMQSRGACRRSCEPSGAGAYSQAKVARRISAFTASVMIVR
ncbi:MAG: hypothetical protein H6944_14860 [Zoogloeaceae bacterium]|nr:hypothetical protein [Zoogloeaceae bacterium]